MKSKAYMEMKALRREELFRAGIDCLGNPICDPDYPAWLLSRGLDPVQYLLTFDYGDFDFEEIEWPDWAASFGVTLADVYDAQNAYADDEELVLV